MSLDVAYLRLFPASIIPVFYVDIGGLILAVVVALCVLYKAKWWNARALPEGLRKDISNVGMKARLRVFFRVLGKDALSVEPLFYHYKRRWAFHFLVFYGFVGLMLTTTLDAIINRPALPLPLTSPVKIIGNISGIMLLVGATPMLFKSKQTMEMRPLGLGDKIFLPVLYLTVLTGFLTEILDYSGTSLPATVFYAIHIAIVTALLLSAPWTRFVHALQAPYLAFYERIRQKLVGRGEEVDYKRLSLAEYAKENFFPEYESEHMNVASSNEDETK